MSLNWNIENVRDYMEIAPGGEATADGSTKYKNGAEGVKTEVLIFTTMLIDVNGVNEDNVAEVYARIKMFEALNGALMTGPEGGVFFTFEDIYRRIGLTVNVTPTTKAAFLKRVGGLSYDNYVREAEQKLKKIEAAA